MKSLLVPLAFCLFQNAMQICAQSPQELARAVKQQDYKERATEILDAEKKREKVRDCHDSSASSTPAINNCMSQEMSVTDANYKAYVLALGGFLRTSPDSDPQQAVETGHKFDAAEVLWARYRKAQCDAVYQLNISGTIRGFAYASCMQESIRRHMNELASVYAEY